MTPSHRISNDGNKVVIHDLEVFCAYSKKIDGDTDDDLKKFDNDRVRTIVENTNRHMSMGSATRLVVMHEKDGDEPKSSVGRFTKISYQERNGVGFIVGDCEVERTVFDKLLATNAFPRRSAEIWQDQNHLSEVALLGRETPRRPLPDTNFNRSGELVTFSRPLRFDMGTVGGGLSTFIPDTKGTKKMDNENDTDLRSQVDMLRASLDELNGQFKKRFAEPESDEDEDVREGEKDEMSADDMIADQFAEEEGDGDGDGVDIDIDLNGEEEDEDLFPASRQGSVDVFAMRRENSRMQRELSQIRSDLAKAKFAREIDAMEQDGYRIPAARRGRLIAELSASRDPSDLIDTWRDLFARDPMNTRIDMSRSSLPQGDIDAKQIAELVREHAGNPTAFAKAVNSRNKR